MKNTLLSTIFSLVILGGFLFTPYLALAGTCGGRACNTGDVCCDFGPGAGEMCAAQSSCKAPAQQVPFLEDRPPVTPTPTPSNVCGGGVICSGSDICCDLGAGVGERCLVQTACTQQKAQADQWRAQNAAGQAPAATPAPTGDTTLTNVLVGGIDTLDELIVVILDIVVQIGSIVLVLALIWTGVLFVTAQGNEEKIKSAREAFFWSVIGGLLLIGAEAISLAIKGIIDSL